MRALFLIAALSLSLTAQAGGKKKPDASTPPSCPLPAGGIAQPVRPAVVKPVQTRPFLLPNGATVDLGPYLNTMAQTAVTSTAAFSVAENPSVGALCDEHLEIRSSVSTLEMNLYEFGFSIGYTASGPLTSIQGEAKITVGALAIDFSIWRCNAKGCTSVAAATAQVNPSDSEAHLTMNFGLITSGASFAAHPSFNQLMRKLMNSAMAKIAASPRVNELPWHAVVREVEGDRLIFDAGKQSRIDPGQAFVVYAVTPSSGACSVYKSLATIHTTRVEAVSSEAAVDETFGSRAPQEGDLIMIRAP